jgi:hypothetical protein
MTYPWNILVFLRLSSRPPGAACPLPLHHLLPDVFYNNSCATRWSPCRIHSVCISRIFSPPSHYPCNHGFPTRDAARRHLQLFRETQAPAHSPGRQHPPPTSPSHVLFCRSSCDLPSRTHSSSTSFSTVTSTFPLNLRPSPHRLPPFSKTSSSYPSPPSQNKSSKW